MKFDLIIIGNELLNGKIQDKNAHYLAKLLHHQGHDLRSIHIIKDDYLEFSQVLDQIQDKTQFVITTGGLGPTKDDKTKDFLCTYFNKEATFNQQALDTTVKQYSRNYREYDQEQLNYHILPKEFISVYNPTGYAPGFMYKAQNFTIASTPGVPSEFQSMVEESILSDIEKSKNLTKHIIFKTWKLPESHIFGKMEPELWEKLEEFGEVSSLPHKLGVDVGVKISTNSEDRLTELEVNLKKLFFQTSLKDFIWHVGPESLEEVIIQKAKAKNLTFGFAESCTGGLCASRITDISGSSAVFWGSVVSYANEVKMQVLDVKGETLNSVGAVSKETALEMAIGARGQLQTDIVITTTGIAGPNGGSNEKPVGTVGIGFATQSNSGSEIQQYKGNREQLKFIFSQAALFKLLEVINES